MGAKLVNVDRQTPMLLPCDLRDWVDREDLVHFVIDAVEQFDLSGFSFNERGSGSAQYPPRMMLSLLIYCYAMGVFSSRKIERLTYQHVAVRYLCADTHPDHDTIAAFRAKHEALLRRCFTELLRVARAMKLVNVGTVHIDGTKVLADASKRATLDAKALEKQLEMNDVECAQKLLEQAAKADATDDDSGYRLPRELADAATRKAKIQAARELLQAQQQQAPEKTARVNLTDPDSRLVPDPKGGFVQGYNAQLAVEKHGVVVGQQVCQATNDRTSLVSTAETIVARRGQIKHLVVDQGYDNQAQIEVVEERLATTVVCHPSGSLSAAKRASTSRRKLGRARMRRARFAQSAAGRKLLYQRQTTVEPVIGYIKHVLGFRRFHVRGITKVRGEWSLVTAAYNCRKLWLRRCKKRA